MGKKATRPEWAERLEHFRKELGWSQAALARKLHVSPMATSRWERGVNQPTAAIYILLGKLAHDPDRWYFWERAGLTRWDLENSSSHRGRHSKAESGSQPRPPQKEAPNLLPVPLYESLPRDYSPEKNTLDKVKPADVVVVPREWCDHSGSTICLRIQDDRMYPLMQVGTTVGVDLKQTEAGKMEGKLVIALHDDKGVIVRWLQRYGDALVLVPENRAYSPDFLTAGWRVVGKVLWWFSKSC